MWVTAQLLLFLQKKISRIITAVFCGTRQNQIPNIPLFKERRMDSNPEDPFIFRHFMFPRADAVWQLPIKSTLLDHHHDILEDGLVGKSPRFHTQRGLGGQAEKQAYGATKNHFPDLVRNVKTGSEEFNETDFQASMLAHVTTAAGMKGILQDLLDIRLQQWYHGLHPRPQS